MLKKMVEMVVPVFKVILPALINSSVYREEPKDLRVIRCRIYRNT